MSVGRSPVEAIGRVEDHLTVQSGDTGEGLRDGRRGFGFGYAHYAVFAAAGAVSAGIEVELDVIGGHVELDPVAAGFVFTVPVAVFILAAWLLLLRGRISATASALLLVAVGGVLVSAVLPVATVAATAGFVLLAVAALEVDRVRGRARA